VAGQQNNKKSRKNIRPIDGFFYRPDFLPNSMVDVKFRLSSNVHTRRKIMSYEINPGNPNLLIEGARRINRCQPKRVPLAEKKSKRTNVILLILSGLGLIRIGFGVLFPMTIILPISLFVVGFSALFVGYREVVRRGASRRLAQQKPSESHSIPRIPFSHSMKEGFFPEDPDSSNPPPTDTP